jgi:hypothetical protein
VEDAIRAPACAFLKSTSPRAIGILAAGQTDEKLRDRDRVEITAR